MQATYAVMAVWAAYVGSVHIFGGEMRVVRPLRLAHVERFARGTLLAVWHMVTWALLTLTIAIALAAATPRLKDLIIFAGIQAAGFAAVFVAIARRELGAAIRLPQWLLLGPLAIGLLSAATPRPGAIAAGAMIGLLGLLHFAWALGFDWPARDRQELSAHVLPTTIAQTRAGRFAPRSMTFVVTFAFVAMSACVVAPELLGAAFPIRQSSLLATIAGIFTLRGVGGLLYWAKRREPKASPVRPPSTFVLYNQIVYSPCCLLIAALIVASVAEGR
jgi:hypothetical protein